METQEATRQESIQKPTAVVRAVQFLWASFALEGVKLLVNSSSPSAIPLTPYVYFVMFFTFVVVGYLIYRISAGENWARLVFLVMFVMGTAPAFPSIIGELSRASALGMIFAAQIAIQIYALFLLFTQPGSSWFSKVSAAR